MMMDDFLTMVGSEDYEAFYEEDIFDGKRLGDLTPIEAERVSAVGKVSTLWEDSV